MQTSKNVNNDVSKGDEYGVPFFWRMWEGKKKTPDDRLEQLTLQ